MSLLTCADCDQPVSSEASACPTCGRPVRDRSYLTPWAQVAIGGLVLVAVVAWPPLIGIIFLAYVGRFVNRARRGGNRSVLVAGCAIVVLTFALIYVMPGFAPIACVLGGGSLIWLVGPRLLPANA